MTGALSSLDRAAITWARLLAMDSVERAGSGHPGTAMSLAPVAHVLYQRHLRHDPADPEWPGRDRFVLSCGHASILQYVQLHLTGYDVGLDDLRSFRRAGSRTPGHPERGHTPGVEATTGPLGQGLATAVGMAMGIAHERAVFDPDAAPGESSFDRTVWVIASDGDLQEGVSYEAAALAGHHQLDNLVVVYDDNDISIDGTTALSQSEDVVMRFMAQGWFVQRIGLAPDGDVAVAALDSALETASSHRGRPSLVVVKSRIAWPAPRATGTAAAHGAPLGPDEAARTRDLLAPGSRPFEVPAEVMAHTRLAMNRGAQLRSDWWSRRESWATRRPADAEVLSRIEAGGLPADLDDHLPTWTGKDQVSTRDASGATIRNLARLLPELWGGSADLAEPNRTAIEGAGSFLPNRVRAGADRTGRNVHWGVREHAMAASMNGIAIATASRVFAGTFLVFSDYQRPAVRLAALMNLPVTYVWTHDSVALGADGPTHQPVEHLAGLRALPGFAVVRPADACETAAAWRVILMNRGPVGLVLGRQPVDVLDIPVHRIREGVARGGYVVHDPGGAVCTVIATGSEVALALEAASELACAGIGVRVVSMPCREWFDRQDDRYRAQVLPSGLPRIVVEAASTFGWGDLVGADGAVVGIDGFGLSAPARDALLARGMTAERVIATVRSVLGHSLPDPVVSRQAARISAGQTGGSGRG